MTSRFMCEMFGLEAGLKFPGIHLVALLGLEDHVAKFIFRPGTKWADARADARDYLGRTPLIWAAAQGNSSVVSTLLGFQADINAETLEGFTPLFYAAAYGHAEMVTMLISWGVYIHSQTRSKETALFAAARGGAGVQLGPESFFTMGDHALVAQLLLDAGSDVNHQNICQETPLYTAAANGNIKVVELLLGRQACARGSQKPDKDPLTVAARKGHVAITRLLLKHGAYAPRLVMDTNVSPHFWGLSCLAESGLDEEQEAFAAMLQDSGSPEFCDEFQRVPLHWAAARGDASLVRRILQAGCSPDPRDIFGRTPLFSAVCFNKVEVVKLLLDHPDIEIRIEDTLGFTPLQESYRRQKSKSNSYRMQNPSASPPWAEVTELLKGKLGMGHEDPLPSIEGLFFARYELAQQPFSPNRDVCLDVKTVGRDQRCHDCGVISRTDGGTGLKTVIYCGSCIQGIKDCPLCHKPFELLAP